MLDISGDIVYKSIECVILSINIHLWGDYMQGLGTLKTDIKSLQDLSNCIGEIMKLKSLICNLPKECRESSFANGEVYPHCKSTHVVKNGNLNGKQRYKYIL